MYVHTGQVKTGQRETDRTTGSTVAYCLLTLTLNEINPINLNSKLIRDLRSMIEIIN